MEKGEKYEWLWKLICGLVLRTAEFRHRREATYSKCSPRAYIPSSLKWVGVNNYRKKKSTQQVCLTFKSMASQRKRHQRTHGGQTLPQEHKTWLQTAFMASIFAPSIPHSVATSYGKETWTQDVAWGLWVGYCHPLHFILQQLPHLESPWPRLPREALNTMLKTFTLLFPLYCGSCMLTSY